MKSGAPSRLVVFGAIGIAIIAGYFLLSGESTSTSSGKPLAVVNVPSISGAALAGEQSFNANCSVCHGANAAGKEGFAPPLVHKIYEPSHHGDMAFVLAAKQGVRQHHWPFGNMPAIPDVSDKEIADIITYIRTLQRANGIH